MTTTATLSRTPRRRRRSAAASLLRPAVPYLVCIGGFLLAWQVLSLLIGVGRLPGPINVIVDTWDPYISQPFFDDGGTSKGLGWQILISLTRVAAGYGLAAAAGIAIGGLLGLNRFIGKGLDPVIQVLRTVPPLAWFPISLMVFQDANTSAIFVIFITAIWPIIINTAVGIREIPQDYTNVARVLKLRKADYIRSIVIPATVPYVFTGLRISVGLAWLAIVAAEMLKADGGIGYFIWDAYNAGGDSSSSQIILAILYVGVVGLALDRLVAHDTGIQAIVLIDAQIDHTTGLYMLREGTVKREIYCTDMVYGDLTSGNQALNILGHYCGINHHAVPIDGKTSFTMPNVPNLKFTTVALKSAAPPYSPHRNNPQAGDTIGVLIEEISTGKKCWYSPGLESIEPHLPELMNQADCIMVDGTFWTDTEMIDLGLMTKTARSIGHNPQSGANGMIEDLDKFGDVRKVLIHINNTNPILREDSAERAILNEHKIEVAYDGMDIIL